jgi:hypothetical protein
MTTRQKWLAGGAALLVAVLIGAGVGLLVSNNDDTQVSTSGTTTSTSSTTTTTVAPAPPTQGTTVTVGIICTTPDDATKSVVNAWMAGDKAAAARCASDTAVNKLFETNGAGAQWTFQGCHGDPGVPTCSYSYEGGGANFKLSGTEAAGWKVVDVTFVAD